MPYTSGERLPGERASRLGHLDVLKSPLVKKLCESFEDSSAPKPTTTGQWQAISAAPQPLAFLFGVDGSFQPIVSETKPYKAVAFVKTALVMLDQPALSAIDKAEPHPFMIRDILERSQVYHATVFPLRYIDIPGQKLYDAIRQVIFDSFRDPSLDGEIFQTFKWLAYEKWDSQERSLPDFQCPHCESPHATLPFDADTGACPACGKDLLVTDMLGFHQVMAEDSAPDSIATDYMAVHETLLLFTGIRHYWESQREVLRNALFVKDGPFVHTCAVLKASEPNPPLSWHGARPRHRNLCHWPREIRCVLGPLATDRRRCPNGELLHSRPHVHKRTSPASPGCGSSLWQGYQLWGESLR